MDIAGVWGDQSTGKGIEIIYRFADSSSAAMIGDYVFGDMSALSPPLSLNSSESETDLDFKVEVNGAALFPELNALDQTLEWEENASVPEYGNVLDDQHSRNVVKVNVACAVPRSEPSTARHSVNSTSIHHNYASLSSRDSKKATSPMASSICQGKTLKYVELEPTTGFAVCGPMSRNAVLARENRRKKKEYVSTLENEIQELKDEKEEVIHKLSDADSVINGLREEVEYLKSVIANETTLGALLRNIPHTVALSSKRTTPTNVNNGSPSKRSKPGHSSINSSQARPGVCLHVAQGSVSLEFCKQCNSGLHSQS